MACAIFTHHIFIVILPEDAEKQFSAFAKAAKAVFNDSKITL